MGLSLSGAASAEDQAVMVGTGDIATDNMRSEQTAKLLDQVIAEHPDALVFTTGDNAYPEGTPQQFNDYYDPTWGRHKARTRPTVGNHEYRMPDATGYFDYFGEAAGEYGKGWYSYRHGAWHVVVLNSEIATEADSPQLEWLRRDLAENAATCILAYFHRPRFSSGTYGENPEMRPFWDTLYEHGADLVLNGHQHSYERFAPQDPDGDPDPTHGIRQIIVGTGGASLYDFETDAPNSEARDNDGYGVLKLTLRETGYDWEYLPVEGHDYSDSGSADCSTTVPPEPPRRTNARVESSSDDAEENAVTGAMYLTSTDVDLVDDIGDEEGHGNVEQVVAMRFARVEVPQGAEILSAHIEFIARDSGDAPTALAISGDAHDDSSRFSLNYRNITGRERTEAKVAWQPSPWKAGQHYETPSLVPIVQEIVDRAGWAPGNAIAIIVGGRGQRSARSHDFHPVDGPQLIVEYRAR